MQIAILAPSKGVFAYQAIAAERLAAVAGVSVPFLFYPVVANGEAAPRAKKARLYHWWREVFHFAPGQVPFEEKVALDSVLRAHPLPLSLRWDPPCSIRLTQSGEELLRSLELDAILNLSGLILRGPLLTIPRYGVWSFHHGDPQCFRGGPPGFWEIYQGAPSSGAMLQRLEERLDDGLVLRQTSLPTLDYSYAVQRHQLFAASIPWPAEVAADLLSGRSLDFTRSTPPSPAPITRWPSNPQMVVFLLKLLRNKVRHFIHYARSDSH